MARLINTYLTLEKINVLRDVLMNKNENGVGITISVNDEADQYGNDVKLYVAQSKEDRESKKQRFYIANGKTTWTNDGSKSNDSGNLPPLKEQGWKPPF